MVLDGDVPGVGAGTAIGLELAVLGRNRRDAVIVGDNDAVQLDHGSLARQRDLQGVPFARRFVRPRLGLSHGIEHAGAVIVVASVLDLHLDALVDGIVLGFRRSGNADEHARVCRGFGHLVDHAQRRIADLSRGCTRGRLRAKSGPSRAIHPERRGRVADPLAPLRAGASAPSRKDRLCAGI